MTPLDKLGLGDLDEAEMLSTIASFFFDWDSVDVSVASGSCLLPGFQNFPSEDVLFFFTALFKILDGI